MKGIKRGLKGKRLTNYSLYHRDSSLPCFFILVSKEDIDRKMDIITYSLMKGDLSKGVDLLSFGNVVFLWAFEEHQLNLIKKRRKEGHIGDDFIRNNIGGRSQFKWPQPPMRSYKATFQINTTSLIKD